MILLPIHLDKIDIAILKSLLEDGRKSFRQISRDTGITTPTVKARYERLVNVGFIKCIIPIFDFDRVQSKEDDMLIQLQDLKENTQKKRDETSIFNTELDIIKKRLSQSFDINITCDFCEGPVFDKPKILKFANIERFFCCTSCKSNYSEKYHGRIESIKRKYEDKSEI